MGLKTSDAVISMENLSAINKKIVDPKANRYFFVSNPVKVEVLKPLKKGLVKIPKHPDKPKKIRTLKVGKIFFVENFTKHFEEDTLLSNIRYAKLKPIGTS